MSRCVRGLETGWRVCPPRGYSARTGRAPRRHKNGEYAAKPPARPAFQRHEAHAEGSDTTPTRKCRKCKTGVLSPPPTGLPPKPSEAVSVGRGRATESASPAACGGTRDSSSARTTASIAFVWSAAKPLPYQMHRAGHGPTPHFRAEARTHQAASVSAETLLPASGGAASKGDQSPFEEPPALRGDERNHFRKVIQHEKRYQI